MFDFNPGDLCEYTCPVQVEEYGGTWAIIELSEPIARQTVYLCRPVGAKPKMLPHSKSSNGEEGYLIWGTSLAKVYNPAKETDAIIAELSKF